MLLIDFGQFNSFISNVRSDGGKHCAWTKSAFAIADTKNACVAFCCSWILKIHQTWSHKPITFDYETGENFQRSHIQIVLIKVMWNCIFTLLFYFRGLFFFPRILLIPDSFIQVEKNRLCQIAGDENKWNFQLLIPHNHFMYTMRLKCLEWPCHDLFSECPLNFEKYYIISSFVTQPLAEFLIFLWSNVCIRAWNTRERWDKWPYTISNETSIVPNT